MSRKCTEMSYQTGETDMWQENEETQEYLGLAMLEQ
jgi:hypothetical protein